MLSARSARPPLMSRKPFLAHLGNRSRLGSRVGASRCRSAALAPELFSYSPGGPASCRKCKRFGMVFYDHRSHVHFRLIKTLLAYLFVGTDPGAYARVTSFGRLVYLRTGNEQVGTWAELLSCLFLPLLYVSDREFTLVIVRIFALWASILVSFGRK